MASLPTVKIVHPDVDGEFCIINEADFQEGVHTRWVDGTAPAKKADGIPDGCSIDHRGGGRYHALVGDRPLRKDGEEEPHLFPSKAEAIAALVAVTSARSDDAPEA